MQQAARGVIAKGVDALFIPNDNTVASALPVLAQEAIAAGLPVYPTADSMVRDFYTGGAEIEDDQDRTVSIVGAEARYMCRATVIIPSPLPVHSARMI